MDSDSLKERFTSRKLFVAIAGAVYFGLQGDNQALLTVIGVYLGANAVEGAALNYSRNP